MQISVSLPFSSLCGINFKRLHELRVCWGFFALLWCFISGRWCCFFIISVRCKTCSSRGHCKKQLLQYWKANPRLSLIAVGEEKQQNHCFSVSIFQKMNGIYSNWAKKSEQILMTKAQKGIFYYYFWRFFPCKCHHGALNHVVAS